MRPLVSVAYHESGHLVMMLALGFPVESVSIVPDADSAGRVVPARAATGTADGPPLTRAQEAVVYASAVMVSLAGAAAEELGGYEPAGCQDDDESVRILADGVWELLDVPGCHWRHVAREAAQQYLHSQWPTVECLAAALLVERTLTAERVRQLVGELPSPDLRNLVGALRLWSERKRASPTAALT